MKIEVDRVLYVSSCRDCPFANEDNTWGYNWCNINEDIDVGNGQLPSDSVHEDCPLKKHKNIVKLEDTSDGSI